MPLRGKGYPGRLTSGAGTVPHPDVNTGANFTLNVKPHSIIPLASKSINATRGTAGLVQRQTPTHPLKKQGFT